MIEPLEAAWEIHNFLTKNHIPYVLIGGLAVQYWGEPRFTGDVDVTVLVPANKTEGFVSLVNRHFSSRTSNPLQFAKETHMVLVKASNGSEIDISLGIPGYEHKVMQRAVSYALEPGKQIRICSAEDLIIHKAVAGRPRDVDDIQGVVFRQGKDLAVSYIRRWLNEFASALDNPDLPKSFESAWVQLSKQS